MEKPQTARSYRSNIIDDNAVISINLKWLGQIAVLLGGLVYGYWRMENRISTLEQELAEADTEIQKLVEKLVPDTDTFPVSKYSSTPLNCIEKLLAIDPKPLPPPPPDFPGLETPGRLAKLGIGIPIPINIS